MDRATSEAILAIVRGLRKSGAISEPHVGAIVRELEAVEPEVAQYGADGQIRFRRLCMSIAADAGIETSIKSAEPPMNTGNW